MMLRSAVPVVAKKVVWNVKYGFLRYPHLSPPINSIQYVCSHVKADSDILELGCGRGSLLPSLRDAGCMSHYCGVDISHYAIAYARKYNDQRSAWIVSDIESFRSPFRWNAILLIESIYYVNIQQLSLVLSRLRDMLVDDGFILIRVHDVERHHMYIDALKRIAPGSERVDATMIAIPRCALKTER